MSPTAVGYNYVHISQLMVITGPNRFGNNVELLAFFEWRAPRKMQTAVIKNVPRLEIL